jgi:hypothetical protein
VSSVTCNRSFAFKLAASDPPAVAFKCGENPDLEPRMEAAREEARQKALEGIKAAGARDWRALAEWLRLTFPEHRSGHCINVSATANALQAAVVITEEKRRELQERFARLQRESALEEPSP